MKNMRSLQLAHLPSEVIEISRPGQTLYESIGVVRAEKPRVEGCDQMVADLSQPFRTLQLDEALYVTTTIQYDSAKT